MSKPILQCLPSIGILLNLGLKLFYLKLDIFQRVLCAEYVVHIC
jgi:hypothetical protein